MRRSGRAAGGDLTSSHGYEGKKFQFLVYGAPSGYRGIRAATTTWGSPKHVYVVGRYRVLVWNHELNVAAFRPKSHGRSGCRKGGGPA